VKGHSGAIARLLTGQAMDFSDAPDWSFRVSDRRVLKEDDCPGRATVFEALQPGSTLLEALWSPACRQSHPACGMPSLSFRVTVIVDAATPLLPVIARDQSPETVGLLNVGETFEVAVPTDFQYLPWQNMSISNADVLRQVDATASRGTGLLVLTAVRPGMADLTADAKSASSSNWSAGFFRIEFVVRAPSRVADVVASDKDSGKTVTVQVGQILAFSLPSESPASQPGLFQGAVRNQPLMIPLERPMVDGASRVQYLMAEAAGTEKMWWSSCPPTQPISASCQPEVAMDIVPAGLVADEASDSDGGKHFTLHPGQEIVVTLHPYIGPWQGWPGAALGVLDTVSNESPSGLQVWTFRAVAPGSVVLDASYPCPSGQGCPLDPLITVEVTGS
jgi:hypothetical protein